MRRTINPAGLATVVVVVAAWQAAVSTRAIALDFLPAPSAIARACWSLIHEGALWPALVHTLGVTLRGWVIAIMTGLVLGAALGLSRPLWVLSMASVEVLRAVPAIVFAPVAILIFGQSSEMELLLVVYVSMWPTLVNTIGGIRNVRPGLRDTARTLRLSRPTVLRKILLPSALPDVVVGVRLSLSLALTMSVVAEMVGNPKGLGYGLVFEQSAVQPARVFAYLLAVAVLGLVLNTAFVGIYGRLWPARAHARLR